MRRLHYLETSAESEKKPSDPGKTENEGIQRSRGKQISGLASSFSLTEKRFAKIWTCNEQKKLHKPDERGQTGILTSGCCLRSVSHMRFESRCVRTPFQHGPCPRLPDPAISGIVGLVTRYSGATVPDFNGVP